METHDQGSQEWFESRLGLFTASNMGRLLAGGAGKTRAAYLRAIRFERETGQRSSDYSNAAMERGIELEPEARMSYELVTGCTVIEAGFIPHPEIAMTGASPDGLVGDDGLVEIKCPGWDQHMRTRDGEAIKRDYLLQMQWQMECTRRLWCDFVSYHPAWSAPHDMVVRRVMRDQETIELLRAAVIDADAEVVAAMETAAQQAAFDTLEEGEG